MLFSKKKTEKPSTGWKISDHKLVNYYTGHTFPLNELAGGYDLTDQLVTFWHQGCYLVTIPCKEALYDTLKSCGLRHSKVCIEESVTFEAKDIQGKLWRIIENRTLNCDEKQFALAGLRFNLNKAGNIRVCFYGQLVAIVVSDDIKLLNKAKNIFMARKYLKPDWHYSSSCSVYKSVTHSSIKPSEVGLSTEMLCTVPTSQRIKVIASHAVCKIPHSQNVLLLATALEKAKELALKNLQQSAANCGANAVFAITLQYQDLTQSQGAFIIHATGTAIHLVVQTSSEDKSVKPNSVFASSISIGNLILE